MSMYVNMYIIMIDTVFVGSYDKCIMYATIIILFKYRYLLVQCHIYVSIISIRFNSPYIQDDRSD